MSTIQHFYRIQLSRLQVRPFLTTSLTISLAEFLIVFILLAQSCLAGLAYLLGTRENSGSPNNSWWSMVIGAYAGALVVAGVRLLHRFKIVHSVGFGRFNRTANGHGPVGFGGGLALV